MEYKKHRMNIYPEMQPDEFERLRTDIFTNGYDPKNPVWLFEGEIIDGWNRYKACQALGITPAFKTFEGSTLDALQFLVRTNNRRDLNSSQRAAIAVEAEDLIAVLKAEAEKKYLEGVKKGGEEAGAGRPKNSSVELVPQSNNEQNKVRTQLAQTFNTNPRYVSDAARLKRENPQAFEAIKAGQKVITQVKQEEKVKALKQAEAEKTKAITTDNGNEALLHVTSASKFLETIEDQSVDLILTDPPYLTEYNDKAGFKIFVGGWLPKLLRKMKPTGRAFICTGAYPEEMHTYLEYFFEKLYDKELNGLIIDAPLVWTYRNTLGQTPKMKYNLNYQLIWHIYTEQSTPLDTSITNEMFSVQDINAPDGRLGDRYHTWQKPDELANRLVRHASKPGDTVIDCFSCTGTFLLAAAKAGRKAIGCEKNIDNAKIAEGRGCKLIG
jgi:DNA modification methylase